MKSSRSPLATSINLAWFGFGVLPAALSVGSRHAGRHYGHGSRKYDGPRDPARRRPAVTKARLAAWRAWAGRQATDAPCGPPQ